MWGIGVRVALFAAGCWLASSSAAGQAAFIRTSTLNALGEAVAQYAHLADTASGRAVGPGLPLPGTQSAGGFLAHPASGYVVASGAPLDGSGALREGHSSIMQGAAGPPLRTPRSLRWAAEPDWMDAPASIVAEPVGGRFGVLSLGGSRQGDYRLGYFRFAEDEGFAAPAFWPLPGAPAGAAVIQRLGRAAVLCADAGGVAVLHIRDVLTGQTILTGKALESAAGAPLGDEPVALAASPDGHRLYALTLGYDDRGGPPTLRLHALDAADGRSLAPALAVKGSAEPGESALFAGPGGVHILSRARPSLDVHYRRCDFTAEGWRMAIEHSMPGTGALPLFAPEPGGTGVALAAGSRIERMPDGVPVGLVTSFDDVVGALAWTDDALLVGDGPRLRILDPASGSERATVAFQSGVVTAIAPAPALTLPAGDADGDGIPTYDEALRELDANNFDSDGDGLADGADDDPLTAAPRLSLPAYIVLRGDAAGHEIRALTIDPPYAGDSLWRIDFDRQAAPWLNVSPMGGAAPGVAYMGVDRIAYGAPEGLLRHTLAVTLTTPERTAIDSMDIDVRVAPAASPIRRIAWLDGEAFALPPAGDSPFARLARTLAAPPHHFSHVSGGRDALTAPDAETAVAVITGAYAARGLITRQALLDFAAQGGGLLFLTGGDPGERAEDLARWLEPAGIRLRPADPVGGAFGPGATGSPPGRWRTFTVASAWPMEAAAPAAVWTPVSLSSAAAVAAGTDYGLGRIAAFPAELLTQDGADGRRAFVTAAIEWLARARRDVSDLDGDGVPDGAEDRNGNGIVDPGESDPLRPDTDGDGVPDGEEDRNRNGLQDPGETSALNPDSDGDGVFDGADTNPLPPREAPVIERIHPASAPAEGGVDVMVQGRNFAPNAELWFGDRRAPRVVYLGPEALIGEAPAAATFSGGTVDMTALNPSVGLRAVLPGSFAYAPLTRVLLSLRETRREGGGTVSVRIDAPAGAAVGRIALRLETTAAVVWERSAAGAMASFDDRNAVTGAAPNGGLWINVTDGVRHHGSGEIAALRWTMASSDDDAPAPTFTIGWAQVLAPNGAALDVEIAGGE